MRITVSAESMLLEPALQGGRAHRFCYRAGNSIARGRVRRHTRSGYAKSPRFRDDSSGALSHSGGMMPLQEGAATPADVLQAFDNLNGPQPGFRPAHAKGILIAGRFTPSPGATSLTRAPHLSRRSTPVTVRFSDATGLPNIPDSDPNASPHGMAIRFHLAEHVHTDIIAHSVDAFPVRTPEEFLEFLRAVHASGPGQSSPTPIESFLGRHPAALAFVQAPKPVPVSFLKESYFSINAHRFINAGGEKAYGRYRILPEGANEFLDETAA